jgi:outer membrane lipoprotein SlyB
MPSLIQDIGAGFGLVHANTSSIVALGSAGAGVDSRITEASDVRITEDGDTRVPE